MAAVRLGAPMGHVPSIPPTRGAAWTRERKSRRIGRMMPDDALLSADASRRPPAPPDALAAILPAAGAQAAFALPEADAATLRHLAAQGMGANTLRALASDLTYLEAWSEAVTGGPLPWPANAGLVLRFIAHHLYDPAERAQNPAHGMPEAGGGEGHRAAAPPASVSLADYCAGANGEPR